ncbi:hypothetical protein STCU_01078 [Strigomonas culicis]|uniref:Uncharacterized protein n=1 Tax=Strigomonas culicis TaxID=28005 RepID=S9W8R1_9TRYP|nr:hypothetical protein STCU_07923 [Strigomonas culicis]EPY28552.1 hypothetical protein STCU_05028 [Strigomonas culicis]EPY31003.1 hypothetical protein STCU_03700 [Strigomonas culicis]EPY35596.1 hypothetical protein STCU_01078 [Strigomonas culicis]|eukprot:EPY23035.1 hypothetical protein STCU_07923 [Strigomonas culicis]
MLRRTLAMLARPKGPPGQRPGKEYRLTTPYRSEVAMISQANQKTFNSNTRELFKKPLQRNNLKAIPRDLGEIPRNYVVKLLFFHQPIRLTDLWEICKAEDDVPLDSAKHLRLVLKIARLQKWIYTEKNQTNNLYYYYIHQSRTNEIQKMVRADEVRRKQQEEEAAVAATRADAAAAERDRAALDDRIVALQTLLVTNVSHIRTYDPTYVEQQPYVTPSGAVDSCWHWTARTRKEEGPTGEAH